MPLKSKLWQALRALRGGGDPAAPHQAGEQTAVRFQPACRVCGQAAARIEVVPPHALPLEWAAWPDEWRRLFAQYRKADRHRLIYDGPGGGNGLGDAIEPERAARIIAVFSAAPDAAAIRAAGFHDGAGFCDGCGCFYCPTHWSTSATGFGTCPRGHGKSLDPHWSPAFDEDDDEDGDDP